MARLDADPLGQGPSVLFVDDEQHLLAGLRRSLRSGTPTWRLRFAGSGEEALDQLAAEHADVVVTDMRMPGMDGAALLAAVQRRHPATIRVVLSGEADRSAVLAASAAAHQFLAKPCPGETLVAVIRRALEVHGRLADPALRRLFGGVSHLPTLPQVYYELEAAIARPDATAAQVGEILAGDVATSAEVLKLTNSAFFGVARRIESVTQAVSLLGVDTIGALVASGAAFRVNTAGPGVDVEALRRWALLRAAMVRRGARATGQGDDQAATLALAGMLRDVGLLVLAAAHPAEALALRTTLAGRPDLLDDPTAVRTLERETFGCTVPEASAYLLGLWGFSDRVVHTVAAHPADVDDPAAGDGELLLTVAHRRAVRPGVPVRAPAGDERLADLVRRWNEACDEVLATAGPER